MFLFIYLLCFFIIIPLQLWMEMYDSGIHTTHKIKLRCTVERRLRSALNYSASHMERRLSTPGDDRRRRRFAIWNRYTIPGFAFFLSLPRSAALSLFFCSFSSTASSLFMNQMPFHQLASPCLEEVWTRSEFPNEHPHGKKTSNKQRIYNNQCR